MGNSNLREAPDETRISWGQQCAAAIFFVTLTVLYLGITPTRFLHEIAPDFGDPIFNVTILRWVGSRFSHLLEGLWNPGFFYPTQGVLALSDHLIGPSFVVQLLDWSGAPAAACYNTLLLAAFSGSAWTFFWVMRRVGISFLGALGGAVAWTFNSFRWSELSHLQVLLALWVPLTLWHFHRLLLAPSALRATTFLLFYALQLSCGSYVSLMIHVPLLAISLLHLRSFLRTTDRRRGFAPLLATVATSILLLAAAFRPYLVVGKSLGLKTPLENLAPYMVTLKSYLSMGARTFYAESFPAMHTGQAQLWPGLVAGGLSLCGLFLYGRSRIRNDQRIQPGDVLMAAFLIACCVFSLLAADIRVWASGMATRGDLRPALHAFRACTAVLLLSLFWWWKSRRRWVATVQNDQTLGISALLSSALLTCIVSHVACFVLLRKLVPGFDAIRVPGRFFVLTSLGIGALVAIAIDELGARAKKRATSLVVQGALLALLVVEAMPNPDYIPWRELPTEATMGAEYKWLQGHDEVKAVLELPFLENWKEAERMYYWTIHNRPIVNGFSGYIPVFLQDLERGGSRFPDAAFVAKLRQAGVTHIIIHLDQYSPEERHRWRGWQRRLDGGAEVGLARIAERQWAMIYRIEDER